MFGEAAFYVGADAGVDAFVGAKRHIYEPTHIYRIPVKVVFYR